MYFPAYSLNPLLHYSEFTGPENSTDTWEETESDWYAVVHMIVLYNMKKHVYSIVARGKKRKKET